MTLLDPKPIHDKAQAEAMGKMADDVIINTLKGHFPKRQTFNPQIWAPAQHFAFAQHFRRA